jgi:hypothetical protein
MSFLDKQFSEASEHPGYSPEELAILRTQVLEPIEADRAALNRRVIDRTASRGFLPSSGLHELDLRDVDNLAEQRRAVAQRDLGIAAIDRRQSDLNRALEIGTLAGVTIPQTREAQDTSRRNQQLAIATLLQQLPRQAMQDAMAVLQGTASPETLFQQVVQLAMLFENQNRYNADQLQALWESVGESDAFDF